MKNLETKTIAKINKVSILMIENGERQVPIKPICEALGLDPNGQIQKIKSHPIMGSTACNLHVVAGDKKEREMACIPLKYVFGWLFTIQSNMVKEEAREFVIKYQTECYEALYRHFTDHTNFMEQKQEAVKEKKEELAIIKKNFNEAKTQLADATKSFNDAIDYPFEEWLANDRQLKIDFEQVAN